MYKDTHMSIYAHISRDRETDIGRQTQRDTERQRHRAKWTESGGERLYLNKGSCCAGLIICKMKACHFS